MLKELIQTYNTKNTNNQKATCLQQILTGQLSNLDGSTLAKVIEQEYNELITIFKHHPKTALEFLFSKLTLEDCIKLMNLNAQEELHNKPGYGLLRAIIDISKSCHQQTDKQCIQWFSKMYTRHASYQKVMIYLTLISQIYHHKFTPHFLPQFIADFINASTICIQHYLKLKSQSPKFDLQYMQYGQMIVNSTQKWVKTFYVNLLQQLRIANKLGSTLQLSMVNAICDVIGALMEIQRQGNIQYQICEQILNQSYYYIKRTVNNNIDQFNNLYVDLLREKKFNIAQKKIVIPEKYTANEITFPKQAFAFVVFMFLKESAYLYSYAQVVHYLLPVVNQFCPFDYQIKAHVEKMFTKYFSFEYKDLDTFVSGGFPLSILWFNLHHYKNNRNTIYLDSIERIFDKLSKRCPSTYVNSLKLLNEYQTQNHENEKIQMIGEKLLALQHFNCKELKILFKVVDLSQLNENSENIWTQVIKRSSQNNDIKAYLQHLLPTKQIKPAFKQHLIKALLSN